MRALRLVVVMALVAMLQVVALAAPARACACGGIEPFASAELMEIYGETALVRHDGTTEDIVLSFDLQSDSESTALVLPLPALADFELASPETFADLFELTRPVIEEERVLRGLPLPFMAGASSGGGAGPGVEVIDEQDLGPITVTQLTSSSVTALADWLKEREFRVRGEILRAAQPYLDEGWVIAVARLDPADPGEGGVEGMSGDLQPIRATFESEKMVYPMRFQAAAESPLPLTIYTLTSHRQNPVMGSWQSEMIYAGRVDPSSLPEGSTLAELADGADFLTRHDGLVAPDEAVVDMTFEQAADDDAYRHVIVRQVDYPWIVRLFVPSLGSALVWVLTAPLLIAVLILVRRLRRRGRNASVRRGV
jgi:hypothetical protein